MTMKEAIEETESLNAQYWELGKKIIPGQADIGVFGEVWSWESFQTNMKKLIDDLGLIDENSPDAAEQNLKIRGIIASVYGVAATTTFQNFWTLTSLAIVKRALMKKPNIEDPKLAEKAAVISSGKPLIDVKSFVALTLAVEAGAKAKMFDDCKVAIVAGLSKDKIAVLDRATKKYWDEAAVLWHDYDQLRA